MSFFSLARRWRSPASGEGEKEARSAPKNPYYAGPRSDHFDGLRFFIPGGPRDKTAGDIAKMLWRSRRDRQAVADGGDFRHRRRPPRRVEGGAIRAHLHRPFELSAADRGRQSAHRSGLVAARRSRRASGRGASPRRDWTSPTCRRSTPSSSRIITTTTATSPPSPSSRDHPAPVLTPLGNDAILHRADRAIRAQAFDWGDSAKVGPLRIHFEPALHWSARGRGDARMALWASFVIEGFRHKIYFAGDTGYGDGSLFKDIGRRHGPIRLALLPIGAYAPRWFMRDHHCDPDEAVKIFSISARNTRSPATGELSADRRALRRARRATQSRASGGRDRRDPVSRRSAGVGGRVDVSGQL